LETLKDLKRSTPSLPVIVLSMYPANQYAVRALRAGAAGYMTKESAPEELVTAIKKVCQGGKYITFEVGELLANHVITKSANEPHKSLSDREFQVFIMLASGKTVGQIASELSLSSKTVSAHRAKIIEKMGVTTNAELIRYALEHNLM
jgi:DNA-binding NarL/FixJ family response regulator